MEKYKGSCRDRGWCFGGLLLYNKPLQRLVTWIDKDPSFLLLLDIDWNQRSRSALFTCCSWGYSNVCIQLELSIQGGYQPLPSIWPPAFSSLLFGIGCWLLREKMKTASSRLVLELEQEHLHLLTKASEVISDSRRWKIYCSLMGSKKSTAISELLQGISFSEYVCFFHGQEPSCLFY